MWTALEQNIDDHVPVYFHWVKLHDRLGQSPKNTLVSQYLIE